MYRARGIGLALIAATAILAAIAGRAIASLRPVVSPSLGAYNVEVVAHSGASTVGIAREGSRLYVATVAGLEILDVANPEHPFVLGEILLSYPCNDVAVIDGFAYLAALDGGVHVVDARNAGQPEEVAILSVARASGVDAAGDTLYVASVLGGVVIFDVTTRASPRRVATLDDVPAIDLTVSGALLAVAGANNVLSLIDVSVPARPRPLGTLLLAGSVVDVGLSGRFAYVAGYIALYVVDIADPTAPQLVGSLEFQQNVVGVTVVGDRAYLYTATSGLWIADIRNPKAPAIVGSVQVPGWVRRAVVSGSYAWLAAFDGGIQVVDVSDAAAPREVAGIGMGSFGQLVTTGERLFVLSRQVEVFDVTGADGPVPLSTLGGDVRVAARKSLMFTLGGDPGLTVVDLADPAAPVTLATFAIPGQQPEFIVADGSRVHVVAGLVTEATYTVVDVADPSHPRWVGSDLVTGDVTGLAVSSPYGALVTGPFSPTLVTYDLRDGGAPRRGARIPIPGAVGNGVAIGEAHAFVAGGRGGVVIFDVKDPTAPYEVDRIGTFAYPQAVAAAAGRLWIVEGDASARYGERGRVEVADVSDPAHAEVVGSLPVFWDPFLVAADGRFGYVASPGSGLYVLRLVPSAATTTMTSTTTTLTTSTTSLTTASTVTSTTTPTRPTTTTITPCETPRCLIAAVLDAPVCRSETIPATTARRLERALELLEAAAVSPRRSARLLHRKAERRLKRASRSARRASSGTSPTLSPSCAAAIDDVVQHLLNRR